MDKKEILQRAQRENQDDGMAAAENRGRKYGFSAFWTLCIAVLIFNGIYDRPNDLPMALMMAYLAAESYPRFAFTRKKSDLVLAILTTIAAAAGGVRGECGARRMREKNESLPLRNRLREVRTAQGLSQSQLADMVGVSRNTISSIETGQFSPTAKLALLLCIALDRKFEDLFYFE